MVDEKKWPTGVSGITIDDMGKMGVDEKNKLYWDGEKIILENKISLGLVELCVAIFVAGLVLISTIIGAWQWGCDLEWLSSSVCPKVK